MPRCRLECGVAFLLLGLGLLRPAAVASAELAPIEAAPAALSQPRTLRLEVWINGQNTQLVEPFAWAPPSQLSATRGDLNAMGLRVPGSGAPRERIALDALGPDLYRFDEAGQRIDFHLSAAQRIARIYDASVQSEQAPPSRSDWGTVLNYNLYGATAARRSAGQPRFSSLNATVDARAFSPFGGLEQTMILGTTAARGRDNLRLDTTYTYSDPALSATVRLGDTISGALPWTRPIRYAGVQGQRNFALRPDIVTLPLPSVSGSAAVPSTVDVFVNNVKAYSQDVAPGPYSLVNIPILASGGSANVVVTDAAGRETVTSLPLFAAATLLAPGLTDFSLDAGLPRTCYGTLSNAYDMTPVGSVNFRHGVTDWLTLEAHGEGSRRLANGGLGAVTRLGSWGVLSTAASASLYAPSHHAATVGGQVFAAYALQVGPIGLDLSMLRTIGRFEDLAGITGTRGGNGLIGLASGFLFFDPRPPKALDRISVSFPLPFDGAAISAGFINSVEADGRRAKIITASLSRPLPFDASFFATVFADMGGRHGGGGVFAGLSFPLGERARVAVAAGAGAAGLDAAQPLRHEDGSVGWRVQNGGIGDQRSVEGAYRSAFGTVDLTVAKGKRTLAMQAQLDGAIGFIGGGGPFVGNRVDDGFALVDAGVAHVPVLQDNRQIGETNAWGQYVVTDLGANQRNRIGIDANGLPSSAEARTTLQVVAPMAKSGVVLDFGVETNVASALVVFQDSAGKLLPAGSKGQIDGRAEPFVVGYGGQAYLRHLTGATTVTIDTGETECHASFDFVPAPARRVIGPVECRIDL